MDRTKMLSLAFGLGQGAYGLSGGRNPALAANMDYMSAMLEEEARKKQEEEEKTQKKAGLAGNIAGTLAAIGTAAIPGVGPFLAPVVGAGVRQGTVAAFGGDASLKDAAVDAGVGYATLGLSKGVSALGAKAAAKSTFAKGMVGSGAPTGMKEAAMQGATLAGETLGAKAATAGAGETLGAKAATAGADETPKETWRSNFAQAMKQKMPVLLADAERYFTQPKTAGLKSAYGLSPGQVSGLHKEAVARRAAEEDLLARQRLEAFQREQFSWEQKESKARMGQAERLAGRSETTQRELSADQLTAARERGEAAITAETIQAERDADLRREQLAETAKHNRAMEARPVGGSGRAPNLWDDMKVVNGLLGPEILRRMPDGTVERVPIKGLTEADSSAPIEIGSPLPGLERTAPRSAAQRPEPTAPRSAAVTPQTPPVPEENRQKLLAMREAQLDRELGGKDAAMNPDYYYELLKKPLDDRFSPAYYEGIRDYFKQQELRSPSQHQGF